MIVILGVMLNKCCFSCCISMGIIVLWRLFLKGLSDESKNGVSDVVLMVQFVMALRVKESDGGYAMSVVTALFGGVFPLVDSVKEYGLSGG